METIEKYPIARSILQNNGWHEKRKVMLDDFLNQLKKEGYAVTLRQKEFLENFSGLEVEFNNIQDIERNIQFFPYAYGISQRYIKLYEKSVNVCSLVPIGGIEGDNDFLIMDDKLQIYACFEYDIAFYDRNIFEVIEMLYKAQDKKIFWNRVY